LDDALFAEISTHVSVTASDANLFVITYSNKNPLVAMQVVKAVVNQYGEQGAFYATHEGQQIVASYKGQLQAAQQQADIATKAASDYYKDHNLTGATAPGDAYYQSLVTQADQARATLANVQTNFNTFSQQLAQLSTGAQGLFHEVDAPKVPTQPESRVKSLLIGGAVGLVIGLLAAIGYFLILVRLDQSVYSSADMPAITDYPVLIQIQKLPRRSATWITRTNGKLITEKGA